MASIGLTGNEMEPEFCKPGCIHHNIEVFKMLKCSSCVKLFHNDCVGESNSYRGSLICHQCRETPKLVRTLTLEVSTLRGMVEQIPNVMSEIKVMLIKQSEELSNLRAINTELSKQLEQKDAELKLKCSQFDQLNTEYLKVISGEKHNETSDKKPKTILIGSSHASNIESTDVSSLFV